MQASPIRILLANHLPIIRSGLRFLLDRDPALQVVAEAANGREALVLTEYKRPDIVLLEMKLPLVSGIEVTRQIVLANSTAYPMFVTDLTDESYVHEAFKAGARGYVAGDSASIDLPRAVRLVARRQFYLSPSIGAQLLEGQLTKGDISERERDLWCLLAAGHDEDEISRLLQTNAGSVQEEVRLLGNSFWRNALPETLTEFVASTWKVRA